jgi:glutamate synthase (NADPH/NADH) large chain
VNPDTLSWQRIAHPHWEEKFRAMVAAHVAETNSRYATKLLHDWAQTLGHTWQVVPKDYVKHLPVFLAEEQESFKRA